MFIPVERKKKEDVAQRNDECNGYKSLVSRIQEMEFSFDVNNVLPFEITIFNGDYRVLNPGQRIRISYVSLMFVKKLYGLI